MPLPTRSSQRGGVLAKEEASYGVAETLSNSLDACELYIGDGDQPDPDPLDYIYDGNGPGRVADTGAPAKMTAAAGPFRQVPFRTLLKGRGTLYSAVLTPPNSNHRWLKGCGYDATYSATPTPQWTYTPTPLNGSPTGLTVRRFLHDRQHDDRGVFSSLNYDTASQNPLGVLVADFSDGLGIATIPTDQTIPTLTHDQFGIAPLVVSGMTVTFDGVTTLAVRRISYKQNRKIGGPRHQTNLAGGNAGYVHQGAMPVVEIEMERPLVATKDFETMRAAGTVLAASWGWNQSVQYNRILHTFAQAQIMNVANSNADGMALVTVTLKPHVTAANLYDYEEIKYS